jgi:hypothetical protein
MSNPNHDEQGRFSAGQSVSVKKMLIIKGGKEIMLPAHIGTVVSHDMGFNKNGRLDFNNVHVRHPVTGKVVSYHASFVSAVKPKSNESKHLAAGKVRAAKDAPMSVGQKNLHYEANRKLKANAKLAAAKKVLEKKFATHFVGKKK